MKKRFKYVNKLFKGDSKQLKGRKKPSVIKVKMWRTVDYFLSSCKGDSLTCTAWRKRKKTSWITIAIKVSAKLLSEASLLAFTFNSSSFWKQKDSRIQCLSAALPCSMKYTYFCCFDSYCFEEVNIHSFVQENIMAGGGRATHFPCNEKPSQIIGRYQ